MTFVYGVLHPRYLDNETSNCHGNGNKRRLGGEWSVWVAGYFLGGVLLFSGPGERNYLVSRNIASKKLRHCVRPSKSENTEDPAVAHLKNLYRWYSRIRERG
jgi:hypothetical protein